ncbi:uncharacterized protein LOC103313056 [Tribolium castaneum]|uniref:Uncharacterized protein n=1 Tax=Tribolium castaneum TaxID=7070 RepID=A0A139WH86_TRICA|nr:PREDICTED: uncharacterized protein LOC103313056 [Tribolium castaneum]KYB27215.1 hypothetical protein TcasGA2_TC033145 [Tribolium castaneum]|eukprot:XP_008193547.1 PREDICTED: uncharacterized protein LOC103313056 [Tribolium castaneum]
MRNIHEMALICSVICLALKNAIPLQHQVTRNRKEEEYNKTQSEEEGDYVVVRITICRDEDTPKQELNPEFVAAMKRIKSSLLTATKFIVTFLSTPLKKWTKGFKKP